MSKPSDYEAIVAKIDARIDELQTVRKTIVKLMREKPAPRSWAIAPHAPADQEEEL